MGRKRIGKRQHILFCIACLILVSFSGCNALKEVARIPAKENLDTEKKANSHFLNAKGFLVNGNFEEALRENQAVLSMTDKTPFADEALFNMGLIHVHYANNKKDYKSSLEFFRRLIRDYPQSPFSEQAKTLADSIETIDKLTKRTEELTRRTEEKKTANESLVRANRFFAQGDYEGALRENNRVLSAAGKNAPADEALFNSGLVYADYRNPKKDFKRSLGFFERIVKEFPQSPLVQQSEIWIRVLRVIEKSKQVDLEIEEMKKEMSR